MLGTERVQQMVKKLNSKYADMAETAGDTIGQLMTLDHIDDEGKVDAKVASIKLKASQDVLDRVGFTAPKVSVTQTLTSTQFAD